MTTNNNSYTLANDLYGIDKTSPQNKYENSLESQSDLYEQQPLVELNNLATYFTPIKLSDPSSVAEQIFGSQTYQAKLSLEHVVTLLGERSALHTRHINWIESRHQDVHAMLSMARRPGSSGDQRQSAQLERLLLDLDGQLRDEELAYWKDTAELRSQHLEATKEYDSTRQRISLLEGIEKGESAYG